MGIYLSHKTNDKQKGILRRYLFLYHTISTFNAPEEKQYFENIVGKGENAGYQHFLLFSQCFLPYKRQT